MIALRPQRLFWHVYVLFFLAILVAAIPLGWHIQQTFQDELSEQLEQELRQSAELVSGLITMDRLRDREKLEQFVHDIGFKIHSRITLLDSEMTIVADSEKHISGSFPIPADYKYGETRLWTVGSTRVSSGTICYLKEIRRESASYLLGLSAYQRNGESRRKLWVMMGTYLGLTLILATFAAYFVSNRVVYCLEMISRDSATVASGGRIPLDRAYGPEEINRIGKSMTGLASQVRDRLQELLSQRNEQEAVLSSMQEGVVAMDLDGKVLKINGRAKDFLDLRGTDPRGKSFDGMVRHSGLRRYVRELEQQESEPEPVTQKDFEFGHPVHTTLSVRGSALLGADGKRIGSLLVFSNVTRLRQLENMRRDFVGNVSHELKTPLTTIQSVMETLEDDEMDSGGQGKRFLGLLSRNVNRLLNLVEDLLVLSRLDMGELSEEEKTLSKVDTLLDISLENMMEEAKKKNVRIEVNLQGNPVVWGHARLIFQAVGNLLSNAVKYGKQGGRVRVEAHNDAGQSVIHITDDGEGIPEEHQARIFERFYRVDKARSRAEGGTGLGLSIVKNIVEAHGGTISLQSSPGKGSCFTVTLPLIVKEKDLRTEQM